MFTKLVMSGQYDKIFSQLGIKPPNRRPLSLFTLRRFNWLPEKLRPLVFRIVSAFRTALHREVALGTRRRRGPHRIHYFLLACQLNEEYLPRILSGNAFTRLIWRWPYFLRNLEKELVIALTTERKSIKVVSWEESHVSTSAKLNIEKKLTAVYAPFKSFLSSLDHLKEGIPDQLDPSAWPTMSGGLKGQILAGYKFLGLIDDNAQVLPILSKLVEEGTRKETFAAILRTAYEQAYAIDLSRATPNQLADALRSNYNVDGSTLEKAQTFFLHAARFVGEKLSPSISRKTRTAPRRKKANGPTTQPQELQGTETQPEDPVKQKAHGGSKTIKLKGGGSATLSFDVDVFSMTEEDQLFVFDQIRRMKEYESSAKAERPATAV